MLMKDTKAVRHGEELDIHKIEPFIRRQLEGLPEAPFIVEQFSAGHSNLTYLLKTGDWEAVLRRPPLGPVAPKAHDMEREFRILTGLNPVFALAPKPLLYCGDDQLTGSPFLLMERKKGAVLDTEFPGGVNVTEEVCQDISTAMVKQLVNLHSIDYQNTGLAELAQPDGFMERQIHGWIKRYERAKTDDIKGVDSLQGWLIDHLPTSAEPAIIHYDYKLNNAMFSPDLREMIGLFDWEMATVGDPLADLGAAMGYWTESSDPDLIKYGLGKPPVTVNNGFFSRREFVQLYSSLSGRDVSNIHYYITFAYFKLAVICQQIYLRYQKGQTNDPRFQDLGHTVKSIIQHSINTSQEAL
ncbi:phosphotransferase family protein [Bacillus sp. 1P06AnD]|uniref:phosphotransferase family protein n=1 Tax=Bacillus sp. 1P06AnD TaxID=3132208 RepID=UPI0039A34CAE